MATLIQILRINHDWAVDRIDNLCTDQSFEDSYSIQCEFKEWLDPNIEEHDIFSLEYIGD